MALEQAAAALTLRQCQTAENMLQQWERDELMDIHLSFPDEEEISLHKTTLGCCGRVVDEVPPKGSLCPSCGATSYSALKPGKLTIKLQRSGFRGKRRAAIELSSDEQLWRKGNKLVVVARLIDRDHDLYKKVIVDPETQQEIHRCEEPLSMHRGHGSAKPNPRKSV